MTNLILAEEEGVLPWQRDPLLQNEKSVLVPTALQGPSSVGSRELGVYWDTCHSLHRHFRSQVSDASNIVLLDLLVITDSWPYSRYSNGRKIFTHFLSEWCPCILKYLQMTDSSWFSAIRSNRPAAIWSEQVWRHFPPWPVFLRNPRLKAAKTQCPYCNWP